MDDVIAQTDSKQTLKGYSPSKSNQTVFPKISFEAIMDMVDSDPVARGALTHFVDKCMEGDYCVLYHDPESNKVTYDKEFEFLLDSKYMFRTSVLRKLFINLKLFNNAFIEIVRNPSNNTTKALNILDLTIVEPITLPNGDPISYKERNTTGSAKWTKDDMVWVKLNDRTLGFAPVDLESMYRTLRAKKYVTEFVAWLFQTGQYKLVHNFKTSNDKDIEDFLAYYEKSQEDFRNPIISKGEFSTMLSRDMKEVDSLIGLLKYYDNQILVDMRIPPMDAGIPDGSGRSNADASTNNLTTHVVSCKRVVEDYISFELFPKINKGNNTLRFAPADRFTEEQVYKIATMMKDIGIKAEVVGEYLFDKGIIFETEDIFEPTPDPNETGVGKPGGRVTPPSKLDQSGQDTRGVGGVSNVTSRPEQ